MTKPTSALRGTLAVLIAQLGQPNYATGTEQDRLDYRTLLLTQNALALLDLPELNPDAAVFLWHLACDRLKSLMHIKLLTDEQGKELVGEMCALYAKYRPELLPRLLTDPEKAKEFFPDA